MTLKQAREAVGWTQVKLAEASGVVQQQVSRYENGTIANPSLREARKILRALQRKGLKGLTYESLFPSIVEDRAS